MAENKSLLPGNWPMEAHLTLSAQSYSLKSLCLWVIKLWGTLQDVPDVELIEITTVVLEERCREKCHWSYYSVWEPPVAACFFTHTAGLWHMSLFKVWGAYCPHLICYHLHWAVRSWANQRRAACNPAVDLLMLSTTTHSLLISTVEIKLEVITKFLASLWAA